MNAERLAIILQVVSFVLVTTDLFGADRLAKLHSRTERWLTSANTFSFWKYLEEYLEKYPKLDSPRLVLFVPISILISFSFFWFTFGGWIGGHSLVGAFRSNAPLSGSVLDVATIIFVVLSFVTWARLFAVIIDGSAKALNAGTGWIITALTKWKMEGTFLLIGTLLFIVASAIQFYIS